MTLIEVLIVVLLLAWLFGFALVPSAGSLIHVLLVVVLVLVILRMAKGQPL